MNFYFQELLFQIGHVSKNPIMSSSHQELEFSVGLMFFRIFVQLISQAVRIFAVRSLEISENSQLISSVDRIYGSAFKGRTVGCEFQMMVDLNSRTFIFVVGLDCSSVTREPGSIKVNKVIFRRFFQNLYNDSAGVEVGNSQVDVSVHGEEVFPRKMEGEGSGGFFFFRVA